MYDRRHHCGNNNNNNNIIIPYRFIDLIVQVNFKFNLFLCQLATLTLCIDDIQILTDTTDQQSIFTLYSFEFSPIIT